MKTECRYAVTNICVVISLVSGTLKVARMIELGWLVVLVPTLAGPIFRLASLLSIPTVILFR